MWECNYASVKEREEAIKIVNQSAEFKDIEIKMEKLVHHFERLTWKTIE